jgi:hypothetical protein
MILERAFHFLKEKKILAFDSITIEDIIKGDHDALSNLQSRPSIIH